MEKTKEQIEYEEAVDNFLKAVDDKIDTLLLNLGQCQEIAGRVYEDIKKFRGGLLPDSELKVDNSREPSEEDWVETEKDDEKFQRQTEEETL